MADGVTVVRAGTSGAMNLDGAIVELIEYADARGFVLRVCVTAEPSRVLHALDLAEDLIDAPAQLGEWAEDRNGLWRGVAVLASAL